MPPKIIPYPLNYWLFSHPQAKQVKLTFQYAQQELISNEQTFIAKKTVKVLYTVHANKVNFTSSLTITNLYITLISKHSKIHLTMRIRMKFNPT